MRVLVTAACVFQEDGEQLFEKISSSALDPVPSVTEPVYYVVHGRGFSYCTVRATTQEPFVFTRGSYRVFSVGWPNIDYINFRVGFLTEHLFLTVECLNSSLFEPEFLV